MKTRKLRIKRKVVVKSRKRGKLNRKISNCRKQKKSMLRRQKHNSRNNFKKRFSRKMRGGSFFTKSANPEPTANSDDMYTSLSSLPLYASKRNTSSSDSEKKSRIS